MAAVTRFGLEGYGVRRVGSFSGKTPASADGPHPVGIVTRFGLEGYGVRRAGSFGGKTASGGGAAEIPHHLPFFATVGQLRSF